MCLQRAIGEIGHIQLLQRSTKWYPKRHSSKHPRGLKSPTSSVPTIHTSMSFNHPLILWAVLDNVNSARKGQTDYGCRTMLWLWLTSGQPHNNKATQACSAEAADSLNEKLGFSFLTSRGYSKCERCKGEVELMGSIWAAAFWNLLQAPAWPSLAQLTQVLWSVLPGWWAKLCLAGQVGRLCGLAEWKKDWAWVSVADS